MWTNRADLLTHLTTGPDATPFPVDDWLHGVARVRERMRNVELTDAARRGARARRIRRRWRHCSSRTARMTRGSACDFPETTARRHAIHADRGQAALLGARSPPAPRSIRPTLRLTYCGLLLDEWVEVVPSDRRPRGWRSTSTGRTAKHRRRSCWPRRRCIAARGSGRTSSTRCTRPSTSPGCGPWSRTQIDASKLAPLLPAVMSSVTTYPDHGEPEPRLQQQPSRAAGGGRPMNKYVVTADISSVLTSQDHASRPIGDVEPAGGPAAPAAISRARSRPRCAIRCG